MIIIREAKPGEEESVPRIYLDDMGKYGTTHTLKDVEKVRNEIYKKFKEIPDNRIVFFAVDKEHIIGTIQFVSNHINNDDKELANGRYIGYIHHLRLNYAYHDRKIGKKLILTVENYAKKRGYKVLTLAVEKSNVKAISIYRHMGYEKFKELKHDEIAMKKDI